MKTDQTQATDQLGSQPIGKLLLHYSIPAVIGMVTVSLYNIVDRIYIGQGVGPLAISGLALTFPLMTLVMAIGTLVGVGSSARLSIVLGMKDIKWARNILGNAMILSFFFSLILVVLSMLFLDEILVAFGGSDQTIPYAETYLRIVIPGSILSNISFSFSSMMRATGFPHKSMYAILIGVGLNVVLDPIFIFALDMGIQGAAVATVLSMSVSALFVMSHFLNSKHPVHFCKSCFIPKVYIIRNIVSIGMAPFLMNVAASAVNIIMNNQLAREGGDLAIGAYGIISGYVILIIMCIMGLCQGMQPIVGYNYGAQKNKRVKDVLLLTIKVASAIAILGFIVCELFPGVVVRAFTSDPELSALAIQGMRLGFCALPVVGFQIVVGVFFQSISKASKSIFMSLTRQVIFLIPILYLFSNWFGLRGVWLSIPVADVLSSVVALLFLRSVRGVFYPKSAQRV